MDSQDRYLVEYQGDVVEFLVEQHDHLRGLMSQVLGTSGAERKEQAEEFPMLRRTHDAETLRRARAAVVDVEHDRRPPSSGHSTFAAMLEHARRLFSHSD